MYVDGNTDAWGVTFPHQAHIDREGKEQSCVKCHHMNYPLDEATGCYACHNNMYATGDAFRHDWHADPDGANLACVECHPSSQQRVASTAKTCDKCHTDMIPKGAEIKVEQYSAPAYVDAMHGVCVDCHRSRSARKAEWEKLPMCPTCHAEPTPSYWPEETRQVYRDTVFNRVVLPDIGDIKEGNW
jgi:Zn finger protein HypA/HybF involved in hydrogenase expression